MSKKVKNGVCASQSMERMGVSVCARRLVSFVYFTISHSTEIRCHHPRAAQPRGACGEDSTEPIKGNVCSPCICGNTCGEQREAAQ